VHYHAILFYSLCTLLFPSDLKDYAGYEDYFLSRRRWFFDILAATYVADVIDTSLKGPSTFIPSEWNIQYESRQASPCA